MQTVTTIGLDIAKSVFQVHGIDAEGKVSCHRTQSTHNRITLCTTALALPSDRRAMQP